MSPTDSWAALAAWRMRGITTPTTKPSSTTTAITVANRRTISTIAISTSAPISMTPPSSAWATAWIAIWRSSVVSAVTRESRSPGAWRRSDVIVKPSSRETRSRPANTTDSALRSSR